MRAVVAVVACALFFGAACPKTPPTVVDAGSIEVKTDDTRVGEGIVPVLEDKGPPDPRAARLCRAVHGLVAERKAACCEPASDAGVQSGMNNVEAACTSAVSAALKGKSTTIDEAKLAACEQAQQAELKDCGWVRALPPAPAEACTSLLAGTLGEGARCRSSAECTSGMRCHGASLLDPGRCGPPRPARAPCGAAVDALAVAVGQQSIERDHPECAGMCVLGRCAETAKAGAPCRAARECGAGNRCEEGVCKAGLVALGGACKGAGCVEGARCSDGKCTALAQAGGMCRDDFDCARGGCVKPAGGAPSATSTGTCGMRCTSWRDLNAKPL
jgi:hypothetical protein